MEIMSMQFLSALMAIVVIDLVLAGDNAIVIGLAARNLPKDLQKKAVFWGAIGAVAVRAILTMAVVWLLKIPGFLLFGGLALIWIAYQMEKDDGGTGHDNVSSATSFRAAIQTIIVADTIMGVDNVLAVAGAAHGSFLLVVIGLLISIPIVMFGSTLILKWIERYPSIIFLGAGVLAWTAAKMITSEGMLASFFAEHHGWKLALYVFVIGIIIVVPLLRKIRHRLSSMPICIAFLLLWLSVFDYLEEYTMRRYFPGGDAPIAMDLIDLVMWLGWIPFVILLQTELVGPKKVSPPAIQTP
ncbi:MAG: TerC family protein [Usitatibacteraceae bacterium]